MSATAGLLTAAELDAKMAEAKALADEVQNRYKSLQESNASFERWIPTFQAEL